MGKAEEVEDDGAGVEEGSKGRMHGVDVQIEEILHGRQADAHQAKASRLSVDATAAGMYVHDEKASAAQNQPESDGKGLKSRKSVGFQVAKDGTLMEDGMMKYSDLREVTVLSEGVIRLEFVHNAIEHVSIKMTCKNTADRDELLQHITEHSLGRAWIHDYDSTYMDCFNHLKHAMTDGSCLEKVLSIPEFAIDFLLRLTLSTVDVKDIKKEGKWPLCFAGAMCWLAFFSYLMLEVAEVIHFNIPALPDSFLGITVCAIGTSFPNAVASIIMSSQNKPAAAIANALGSNVQNVFLAMALPWVIYIQTGPLPGQPIPQNVAGITEGVAWMAGTLLLLVIFVATPAAFTLTKAHGYIFFALYASYLIITSGETFGWWPPLIPA